MTETITVETMQALIDASPFHQFCRIQVLSLDHERIELVLKLPMRAEFERRSGTGQWHGGPIAAFIDSAGDFALALHVGAPVPTINYRIDYLRPAFKTDLTATATVRRAGRTVGVVDIDVCDDQGRVVSVGRGCYATQAG